jgi:hypothetical protein
MPHTFPSLTEFLTYCINNQQPIIFAKFGDGEYQCARHFRGHNCDSDNYTPTLGHAVKCAFVYLSQINIAYLGAWHTAEVLQYWNSLTSHVPPSSRAPKWVDYHSIIVDVKDFHGDGAAISTKILLYRAIQQSPLQKIIVCNPLLIKAGLLFQTENIIQVSFRNWFDGDAVNIYTQIAAILTPATTPAILIFASGMGSKPLIAELHKQYPNNIYLDFGSALDLLCTKRDSRGRGYSYETLHNKMASADILPPSWDDPKYNDVYVAAQKSLGIHLG